MRNAEVVFFLLIVSKSHTFHDLDWKMSPCFNLNQELIFMRGQQCSLSEWMIVKI